MGVDLLPGTEADRTLLPSVPVRFEVAMVGGQLQVGPAIAMRSKHVEACPHWHAYIEPLRRRSTAPPTPTLSTLVPYAFHANLVSSSRKPDHTLSEGFIGIEAVQTGEGPKRAIPGIFREQEYSLCCNRASEWKKEGVLEGVGGGGYIELQKQAPGERPKHFKLLFAKGEAKKAMGGKRWQDPFSPVRIWGRILGDGVECGDDLGFEYSHDKKTWFALEDLDQVDSKSRVNQFEYIKLSREIDFAKDGGTWADGVAHNKMVLKRSSAASTSS